jgi:hypothetical protein
MTDNEILEMVEEAGGSFTKECCGHGDYRNVYTFETYELLTFAKLIAKEERESCAEVADKYSFCRECGNDQPIAEAIRARGQE